MKEEMQIRKVIGFSMFMLLKSQTSAIKFVFSFIPKLISRTRKLVTCQASPMLFTIPYKFFLSLINGKMVAHLFKTFI